MVGGNINTDEISRIGRLQRLVGDLYSFNRDILGYNEMAESPHRLMCDSIQQSGTRHLDLWPRGTFKSTMITIGYVIQQVSLNPNIRILIANATLQNARSFLREIKSHFERNEELRKIIGDQVSREDKWTDSEIIVKGRTKNLKEPTIQVAGVGMSLVSQHYDMIIGDDLVNTESVNTPEQIEKTKIWFKMAMSLLEPTGKIMLIGTRYHFDDLYGWIIKEHPEYNPQIHSIYNEDGSSIFPERFTPEVIADIKKTQGSYLFSCQYLNSPIDDENAKFKKSQIKYKETLPDKSFFTTMTVDRAYSLNKTADYTGITIRKKDSENFRYVPYARRARYSEGELINKIFDLKEHYKVDKIGIEQNAFMYTLKPTLDEEMRRRNVFFEVVEIKNRASKIARIEGLVPYFESGSIYFVGDEKDFVDMEEELLRFPMSGHDDLADSLAMHDDEEMEGGAKKHHPILGYTGGDPTTGFGRRPIRKRYNIDMLE